MNLTNSFRSQLCINATEGAAGTSDINGDAVDMRDFDGCLIHVTFGAITSTAVTSIHVEGSDDGSTGWTDLTGTNQTVADDDDNQIFEVVLVDPAYAYVRVVVDRGTANAVVASAVATCFHPHTAPISTHADVGGSEVHVGVGAGTI